MDDIVPKKVNKGSTIVITDENDYRTESHNKIFNDEYHKPLKSPVYLNTIDQVNSILVKLLFNAWLDNKQIEYLRLADNPRSRMFYTLTKNP